MMGDVVLEIQDLRKSFDGRDVLTGITARVERGQVIGIVGLNGAGKTTLLEVSLGFSLPDSGSTSVFGVSSAELGGHPCKAKVGFVPQQDELLGSLTGNQYLTLLSEFYESWDQEIVDRLTREWRVPVTRLIDDLSLGERQKLSIVSALGHQPELIVLDEPVASLDPIARRQFLQEIVALAADRDATILFSTHIVTDLERVAERIWFIKDGELVIDETLDALKENRTNTLEDMFLETLA